MVINGRSVADSLISKINKSVSRHLTIFILGRDSASLSFIKQKINLAKRVGIKTKIISLPTSTTSKKLISLIEKENNDVLCGGIVIQLPLPSKLNRQNILNSINIKKDVDVLSGSAKEVWLSGFFKINPPAVGVLLEIIKNQKLDLKKSSVAVVGLGFLVGRPIASYLVGKCKKLYLLDKGNDLKVLKNTDLIISGVGRAGLIKSNILKRGALVIDFGYQNKNGKMSGDFYIPKKINIEFENKKIKYTPTPGGTGPILVVKLLENFLRLNS
jgi:methylenetetrahydrofolate dehydrogenase (NADP+)/methenyltetrahydrofolate cyclohydrolase